MEGSPQFNQALVQQEQEQEQEQEQDDQHHVLHPAQEEILARLDVEPIVGKLEVAPGVGGPRKVFRPGDHIKKMLANTTRAAVASVAVVAGVSGALGAGEAKADQFGDQLGAAVAASVINGIANNIRQAQSVPTFAPGASEQLQAMGILYDPATRIFYNRSNPQDEPISFGPKTMSVRISPIAGGVVFSAMVSNGAGGSFLERLMVTAELVKVAGQPDRIVLRKSRI